MTDMQDVDHTHPDTDENFGDAFRRGPDVAADGGSRNGTDDGEDEPSETVSTATMEEVDHTSEADGVDRTFERGTEGRSDAV